jgi:cytochrome c peroxidase
MRQRERLLWGCASCVLGWCVLAGCQPVGPYKAAIPGKPRGGANAPADTGAGTNPGTDRSGDKKTDSTPPTVDPAFTWEDPIPADPTAKQTPLVFVSADQPGWEKLTKFWNPVVTGKPEAVVPTLPGAPTPMVPAVTISRVDIRVPLGLENPADIIPNSNRPTLEKWQLGKKLFFDETWLHEKEKVSCATCHRPEKAFTDGKPTSLAGRNTPTLVNVVYNTHQFWDGRATALEQVVQLDRMDEVNGSLTRHSWPGVVKRLRSDKEFAGYRESFRKVFGTAPTQDALGKALATYMRTILLGDSVHDLAVQSQKKRKEAFDFTDYRNALAELKEDKAEDRAKVIFKGYQLFMNKGERKAACVNCHTNFNFTDNGFHNVGIDDFVLTTGEPGGQFRTLPPGLKDPATIRAYKTPTLRALLRTGPYFHDGSVNDLNDAIVKHLDAHKAGDPHLDPELKDLAKQPGFSKEEIQALVSFLEALDGPKNLDDAKVLRELFPLPE